MAEEYIFILLGVGVLVIGLRIYVRVAAFGWRGLMADDYLMLVVVAPYATLSALVHISTVDCRGLSNDRMTGEERASLDPNGEEYATRIRGAKLVLTSRILYTLTIWLTKAAMLAFCKRLTDRFGEYRWRIRAGFILLTITWLADFLTLMLNCRPLHRYWQIQPNPGRHCYAGSAPYGLAGTLSLNIITSLYVLFVPLPILWMANIKFWKKLGLVLLISGNGFVIAAACVRAYILLTTRRDAPEQANRWSLQVCFVAIVTTNLPLFFPLISRWISVLVAARPRQLRTITVFDHTPSTVLSKSQDRRRMDSAVEVEDSP